MDQVLERHWVLPLNSLPAFSEHNGSMERGMRDLKAALDALRLQNITEEILAGLEVEPATHVRLQAALHAQPILSHDNDSGALGMNCSSISFATNYRITLESDFYSSSTSFV
jgi:hypothetical protein